MTGFARFDICTKSLRKCWLTCFPLQLNLKLGNLPLKDKPTVALMWPPGGKGSHKRFSVCCFDLCSAQLRGLWALSAAFCLGTKVNEPIHLSITLLNCAVSTERLPLVYQLKLDCDLALCQGSADFQYASIWKECGIFASAVECCRLTFFCTPYNDSLCTAKRLDPAREREFLSDGKWRKSSLVEGCFKMLLFCVCRLWMPPSA